MSSGIEKIISWCILSGGDTTHRSFIDNFEKNSRLWYFCGIVGNKKITFNYRKYGKRVVLYRWATIQTGGHILRCDTITKLKEAIAS